MQRVSQHAKQNAAHTFRLTSPSSPKVMPETVRGAVNTVAQFSPEVGDDVDLGDVLASWWPVLEGMDDGE